MEEQFLNPQLSSYSQNPNTPSNSNTPFDLSPLLQPSQSASSSDASQVLLNSPSNTSPFSNNFNLYFSSQQPTPPQQLLQNQQPLSVINNSNSLDHFSNNSQDMDEEEELLDDDLSENEEGFSTATNSNGTTRSRSSSTNNTRRTGPVRRSKRGGWTDEEDELLRQAVQLHGGKNWKRISECLQGRSSVQCLHRWQKVLNPNLVKGPWTAEEDELIIRLVKSYGAENWSMIASHLDGRIGKQCRERWFNHLSPSVKKDPWTEEEERVLLEAQSRLGNKWAEISKLLPGRTDNSCKNHFNSIHSKQKKKEGDASKGSHSRSNSFSSSIASPSVTPATMSGLVTPIQAVVRKHTNNSASTSTSTAANRKTPSLKRTPSMDIHQRSVSDSAILYHFTQQQILQQQQQQQQQQLINQLLAQQKTPITLSNQQLTSQGQEMLFPSANVASLLSTPFPTVNTSSFNNQFQNINNSLMMNSNLANGNPNDLLEMIQKQQEEHQQILNSNFANLLQPNALLNNPSSSSSSNTAPLANFPTLQLSLSNPSLFANLMPPSTTPFIPQHQILNQPQQQAQQNNFQPQSVQLSQPQQRTVNTAQYAPMIQSIIQMKNKKDQQQQQQQQPNHQQQQPQPQASSFTIDETNIASLLPQDEPLPAEKDIMQLLESFNDSEIIYMEEPASSSSDQVGENISTSSSSQDLYASLFQSPQKETKSKDLPQIANLKRMDSHPRWHSFDI